jgi:phosphodiesterase/alkaline phosphatase D-like protein
MPVRDPEAGRAREALLRNYDFGDLLSIAAIETRLMARDRQLEYNEVVPTLKTPEDIDNFRRNVLGDETREMLGSAQIDFLSDAFERSRGKPWRLIANQVIMAKVTAPDLSPHVSEEDIAALEAQWDQARAFIEFSKLGLPTNLDAWDGYPAARERLYGLLREKNTEGLIVLTGDTHTWWANDLVADNGDKMGVELGVHSVTSPSPYGSSFLGGKGADYALLTAKDNKDVRYISGEYHGYIDLHVTKTEANARYMAVDRIDAPDYQGFEKVSFRIEKENGVSKFTGKKGLSFKEGFLF